MWVGKKERERICGVRKSEQTRTKTKQVEKRSNSNNSNRNNDKNDNNKKQGSHPPQLFAPNQSPETLRPKLGDRPREALGARGRPRRPRRGPGQVSRQIPISRQTLRGKVYRCISPFPLQKGIHVGTHTFPHPPVTSCIGTLMKKSAFMFIHFYHQVRFLFLTALEFPQFSFICLFAYSLTDWPPWQRGK